MLQTVLFAITVGGIPTSLQQWGEWIVILGDLGLGQIISGAAFIVVLGASIWDLKYNWKGLPWERTRDLERLNAPIPLTRPKGGLTLEEFFEGKQTVRNRDHWLRRPELHAWLVKSESVEIAVPREKIPGFSFAAESDKERTPRKEKEADRIIWEFESDYPQAVVQNEYHRAAFFWWLERRSS